MHELRPAHAFDSSLGGRYQFVNIKLDKTGGLTTALELAARAHDAGFGLMVGCMLGSSLSMAPVDLDGPLLQAEDCANGIVYECGVMQPFTAALWG